MTDDGSGPADGEERIRTRRVPGVIRRTVPAGEPGRRPRRQHLRRRHVPRRRAGRRNLERVPHRLHQVARDGAAGRQGPDLARRLRQRRGVRPCRRSRRQRRSSWCRRSSNPKGWWRDTAQRLLVERGDASVAPALKTLAGERARLADAGCTRCGRSTDSMRSTSPRFVRRWPMPTPMSVRPRSGCRSAGWRRTRHSRARCSRSPATRTGTSGVRWPRRSARCRPRNASLRRWHCSPATARTRSSSTRRSAA